MTTSRRKTSKALHKRRACPAVAQVTHVAGLVGVQGQRWAAQPSSSLVQLRLLGLDIREDACNGWSKQCREAQSHRPLSGQEVGGLNLLLGVGLWIFMASLICRD